MIHDARLDALRRPCRVWSRHEVLQRPSPIPAASGIYAWFFRTCPKLVPVSDCHRHEAFTLLYVGIAPRPPAKNGRISRRTLRTRIRQHYALNAEGSTLRLTLGCLVQEELGLALRRVGSGERMTFGRAGEQRLSEWMAENAFVAWVQHPTPWEVESALIRELRPPLNLADNSIHPFHSTLSAIRRTARTSARLGGVRDD